MKQYEDGDAVEELASQCIDCGLCADHCMLLKEIDESPASIALRGAELEEAFACSLCRLCEEVCPLNLSPARMFAEKRFSAVAESEIDINEYRYLFPDRHVNVMSFFRQYYGIDYSDLNLSSPNNTAFFPGCTMMTYSPELSREVYTAISKIYPNPVFITKCCGKPLYQLGLQDRGDKNRTELAELMERWKIKRLIVACPNCYYELKQALVGIDIDILTIYEVLLDNIPLGQHMGSCTIHDSCPDRFEGIFGAQVRQALERMGYQLVEMKHSQEETICCGSGGQISHFRPDLAEELVELRLEEAEQTGANILAGYCHSCVLNFATVPSGVKVRHALNLILGLQEDYSGIRDKAAAMLAGPDAEDNWLAIMAEAGED